MGSRWQNTKAARISGFASRGDTITTTSKEDDVSGSGRPAEARLERLLGRHLSQLALTAHAPVADILAAVDYLSTAISSLSPSTPEHEETTMALEELKSAADALSSFSGLLIHSARLSHASPLRWAPAGLMELVAMLSHSMTGDRIELLTSTNGLEGVRCETEARPILSALLDATYQASRIYWPAPRLTVSLCLTSDEDRHTISISVQETGDSASNWQEELRKIQKRLKDVSVVSDIISEPHQSGLVIWLDEAIAG